MKYLNGIVACIMLMLATACNHHEDEPVSVNSDHTILIYMIGDNNLTGFCRDNTISLQNGLLKSEDDINLIIYKDNKDTRPNGANLPVLFQLKKTIDKKTHLAKIDTIPLYKYDTELNSCSIEVIQDVVDKTFKLFNTSVKGMVFWGHGFSWTPSNNFMSTKGTRYIGFDEQNSDNKEQYIEIWDIRKALEKCSNIYFDYMMFDACNMGTAEVAYEFAEKTDFIAASAPEVIDAGFPYDKIIQTLSHCQSTNEVKKTLQAVCKDFQYKYADNGTFSIIETKYLDNLIKKYKTILSNNKEKLQNIEENPASIEKGLQHFGGPRTGSWYFIYDLQEFSEYLGESVNNELADCIAEYYYANEYVSMNYGYCPINRFSGLGVSIPEIFSLASNYETIKIAYSWTRWGKYLGY